MFLVAIMRSREAKVMTKNLVKMFLGENNATEANGLNSLHKINDVETSSFMQTSFCRCSNCQATLRRGHCGNQYCNIYKDIGLKFVPIDALGKQHAEDAKAAQSIPLGGTKFRKKVKDQRDFSEATAGK